MQFLSSLLECKRDNLYQAFWDNNVWEHLINLLSHVTKNSFVNKIVVNLKQSGSKRRKWEHNCDICQEVMKSKEATADFCP